MFRFRVFGRENIPAEGGVILCGNHISYHDPIALGIVSSRDLNYLAKKELFRRRFVNWVLTKMKAIPVDRENVGMDSLKQVVKALKAGEAVGIFMQGGRRSEVDAADYKAGVALFAIKGKAPVVPIHINATYKLFSKVIINVGEPISFEEYYGKKVRTEELNEAAQKVMDSIVNLGVDDCGNDFG
jgi:1-acyl-sn-glycerol-3-phosphate acyltransferase